MDHCVHTLSGACNGCEPGFFLSSTCVTKAGCTGYYTGDGS